MLNRKMIRDFLKNKTQFISIFLLIFLGVFVYSGVSGEWRGLKRTLENYYSDTNFSDAWLYGEEFTDEDVEKLKSIEGIKKIERRTEIETIGDFENKPKINLMFIEKNEISAMYLVEGEEFKDNKDGIWLSKRFTDAKGLKIGDQIKVKYNEIEIEKEIKGLVYNPEYVYSYKTEGISMNYENDGFRIYFT